MDRIPLGISRLDSIIGGGAPAGSVVLVAGESGAGSREFCYTSTAMNALGTTGDDLFDLYYGDLEGEATFPDEIHYLSFTSERGAIEREMRFVMDDELIDSGVDHVSFLDLAREYFQPTPVPTDWYTEQVTDIRDLGSKPGRRNVLSTLGDYLSDNAWGNLVVVDSMSDLIAATGDQLNWEDLTVLMKGLTRASHRWSGLILILVNTEALTETQLGQLKEAADGTLVFEWESGGSERARTLVVEQFRGVLSRIEDENIVQFETEIHDGGFDISNVRKIR